MDTKKSRPSSFWVPRKAIDLLVKEQATSIEICAYLVLASHTDESGYFSTAGLKKIVDATGASKGYSKKRPGQAQRAIDRLLEIGGHDLKPKRKKADPPPQGEGFDPCDMKKLIYGADDYARMTGVELPQIPGLHQVRYVVNMFNADRFEDGVWFDRGLVEGTGHFKKPLKRLSGNGDVAARLLLKLHEAQTCTYVDFEGVQPYGNGCMKYTTEHKKSGNGFTYWIAGAPKQWAYASLYLPVIGLSRLPDSDFEEKKAMKIFWNALESLESTGFTDEVLTVLNREPGDRDAMPLYEITVMTKHGYITKSDQPYLFLNRLDRILEHKDAALALSCKDGAGRHINYPVISRVGVVPHVTGVVRCRFRPMNWKQHTVNEARDRRQEQHKEWSGELALLEKALGMDKQKQEASRPPVKDIHLDEEREMEVLAREPDCIQAEVSKPGGESMAEILKRMMDQE